jgi:glucose-1-phosphate thymidylyltransferase
MKGIICAGGRGTRLNPLTKVVNKHLLPIYDKPMVYYPLGTLIGMGINDITIVTGSHQLDQFKELIGDGSEFNCTVNYAVQDESLGIANAIYKAKEFCEGSKVAVILGDNIFFEKVPSRLESFENGCELFLKEVHDPERFGVPTLDGDKIIKVTEKPIKPDSEYAVTGLYIYDQNLFEYIERLKPSDRGEYEVTDLSNIYLKESVVKANFLNDAWLDAGTFESLYKANELVRERITNSDRKSILKTKDESISSVREKSTR